MRKTTNRILSLLLSFAIIFSLMSLSAFADAEEPTEPLKLVISASGN